MNWLQPSLGWDDTIRPTKSHCLSHNITKLSLSPENKRKRRIDDPPTNAPHPTTSAVNKRARISISNSRSKVGSSISLRRRLDALDRQQLVQLVEKIVDQQPEIAQAVDELVPDITVKQASDVLRQHAQDIKTHIPLGNPQGDYAFLRVRPLYTAFFVALADYTVSFLEQKSGDVGRALEFLDLATEIVHGIPRWNTASHNQLLQRAYRELEQAWTQALDRANGSTPFAMMAGAAWEQRFHEHCEKSKGIMSDSRVRDFKLHAVPRCEGVIS